MYIRKFKKEDIDNIVQIWYGSNIDTYTFMNKQYLDQIIDRVRSKFLISNIYVYDEEDIVKGFILIDNGYIDELYVLEKYRSSGIGKRLLDFVKRDNNKLELNVFQKNIRAINFYKKHGFKIVEENVEDYTKEKGYLMVWEK